MSERHRPLGGDLRDCGSLRGRGGWRATCWRSASRENPMHSPSTPFFAICPALLLLASPAAARRPHKVAAESPREKNECMRIVSRDEALAEALRSDSFRDF